MKIPIYSRIQDERRELAEFKAAEQKRNTRPDMVEYGATGTTVWGGLLAEEDYNADLEHEAAMTVYDKMRRSDGQVKAALLACELPLRSANWGIEPASEDAKDVDIAEFVEDCLFESMTITWDDYLRHVFMMFPFGFMTFEKVFEVRDGKVCWRKLAPRLPKSIYDFGLDEEGGLSSVIQYTYKVNTYEKIPIPIEKCLVFTHEREGSNYRGVSLLRAAYKHWYFKDNLYRIDGMAAERHGLGVPDFRYPTNTGSNTKTNIDNIGQRLYAHQKSYIALPVGYEFEMKGVNGALHDTMKSVEHHDIQIVRSVLAHFLNLGSGDVGSWALSRDQSSFFLMSLKAAARNVCNTMNRYAINQLVDYNFEGVKKYPKLTCTGLEVRDLGSFSDAVSKLVNVGALTTDIEIENQVRELLELPEKEAPKEEGQKAREVIRLSSQNHERPIHLAEKIEAAKSEPYQIFMKEMGSDLDKAEADIVKKIEAIQKKQIKNLVDQAVKLLKANKPEKLKDIDVRYKDEVTQVLANAYDKLYRKGQKDVAFDFKENVQRAAELPILTARALATQGVLSSRLKDALTWQALNQFSLGIVDESALTEVLNGLSLKAITDVVKIGVSSAYNIGRKEEADKHDVQRVYRQALMDDGTCDTCADLHNKEWQYKNDAWHNYEPPDDRRCEGRDRCRCVLVFVGKEG